MAVYTNNGEPRSTLWSVPLDGAAAKKLVEDPQGDAEGYISDPFDDSVQAVRFSGADRPMRWLDPATQKRYAALERTFAGRDADIVSRSADNKRIVVEVDERRRAHGVLPDRLHRQACRHRR